jgi:hypothetical protein
MSAEDNKGIARRYWDAWNTGNVAIYDEIFAPDHIFHTGDSLPTGGGQLHVPLKPVNKDPRYGAPCFLISLRQTMTSLGWCLQGGRCTRLSM